MLFDFRACYVWFLLLMAGHGTAFAQDWDRVGPGGGGATFLPTFSYGHPLEFMLRCDMTGAYHTRDGGESYKQINFPNGAHSFAFDPSNEQVIYVGSSALYRSTDRGDHWTQLYPRPDQVIRRRFIGDHAEPELIVAESRPYWPAGQVINTIRVDTSGQRSIYFTVGQSIFLSHDEGETWMTKDLHAPLLYSYLAGRDFYVFSADSIYDLRSGNIKASALPASIRPVAGFAAGKVNPSGAVVIYALTDDSARSRIWTSRDSCRTWRLSTGFPPHAHVTAVSCAEFDAAKAYVLVDGVWYGVWKTGDGGSHWDWVWKAGGGTGRYGVPDGRNPSNLVDGWAGAAFGKEWVEMMGVGVAPYDGNIAIATDWYRVMRTTDGGRTWAAVYSRAYPDGRAASTGLDVTTTYGVHFDPYDRNHIAVSCTDIGYHHSFDGGKTWIRSVSGVPSEWVNTCYWVAFDPAAKGKLWSAWSGMHDLPRLKMTRDPQWKTHCRGGVCVSGDGGRSWTPLAKGMDSNAAATCIVVDAHSPVGHRILYVTVYNKGVFKSVDDGKTWALKNNGIGDNTCAFRIVLASNNDLYLVTSLTPDHGNPSGPLRYYSGAAYKSTDGAEHWSRLDLPQGDGIFPSGVTVDPSNPQRVYVACWSDINYSDLFGGAVTRAAGGDRRLTLPGGIFLSEDGGQHWTSIFDKKEYVYDVTVDSHHPGRVYCNTFTGAAWRSDDYGRHWWRIQGYDFQWGHRVIVDENDPEKVYLTTYGSGVWHGYPRP